MSTPSLASEDTLDCNACEDSDAIDSDIEGRLYSMIHHRFDHRPFDEPVAGGEIAGKLTINRGNLSPKEKSGHREKLKITAEYKSNLNPLNAMMTPMRSTGTGVKRKLDEIIVVDSDGGSHSEIDITYDSDNDLDSRAKTIGKKSLANGMQKQIASSAVSGHSSKENMFRKSIQNFAEDIRISDVSFPSDVVNLSSSSESESFEDSIDTSSKTQQLESTSDSESDSEYNNHLKMNSSLEIRLSNLKGTNSGISKRFMDERFRQKSDSEEESVSSKGDLNDKIDDSDNDDECKKWMEKLSSATYNRKFKRLKLDRGEDSSRWRIDDSDLLANSSFKRYYSPVTCNNCNEKGHVARQCHKAKKPEVCFLCGISGHSGHSCSRAICTRCSTYGHTVDRCYIKAGELQCEVCDQSGHAAHICPTHWRSFYNITTISHAIERNSPRVPKKNRNIWCSNCAKPQHYGFQCKNLSRSAAINSPFIVSPRPSYVMSSIMNSHSPKNSAKQQASSNFRTKCSEYEKYHMKISPKPTKAKKKKRKSDNKRQSSKSPKFRGIDNVGNWLANQPDRTSKIKPKLKNKKKKKKKESQSTNNTSSRRTSWC